MGWNVDSVYKDIGDVASILGFDVEEVSTRRVIIVYSAVKRVIV